MIVVETDVAGCDRLDGGYAGWSLIVPGPGVARDRTPGGLRCLARLRFRGAPRQCPSEARERIAGQPLCSAHLEAVRGHVADPAHHPVVHAYRWRAGGPVILAL